MIHTHELMTIVNTRSPALRCAYILFLNRDSDHLGLRSKLILCKVQEKRFGQVNKEEMFCLLLILIHTYRADQSVDDISPNIENVFKRNVHVRYPYL